MRLLSFRSCVTAISLALLTGSIRTDIATQSAQPIRTDKRGAVQISYYENPPAIAVATTFYVIGSQANSTWRDFLALTASFAVRGQTICQPQFVEFSFASSTRAKGGKYQANHQLTILTDGKLLLSTDLRAGPVSDNYRGRYLELLSFRMPFEQFKELARAKKVAITLGGTRASLKHKHLEGLLGMLQSIQT